MIDNAEVKDFAHTEELTLEVVKNRAVKGVLVLTSRTFILQLISLFSTFLLTVFLSPSEYGTFFIVSAVVSFFAYFSDIGFAPALIQKKDQLTESDLKTTFTIQQGLVISIILIIVLTTPLLKSSYKLADGSVYLLYALVFSLFTASLKTIPSIILERKLEFSKLVIPQVVEALLFNVSAVFFAWKGFGINSFTYAVLIRSISGLLLTYLVQPWKPGIAFSKSSFSNLFHTGLPYQGSTFLAVFKDDGMIAILGSILSPNTIGLLGWAQKWAAAPLRFFMDQIIKVTFPAYARMQGDKVVLSKAVSKSIFFISFIVFPSLVVLVLFAPILVIIIPKYTKWQPAIFALTIFSFNAAFGAVTTPLTNVLNAIGKVTTTFKLMIMWTTLTWIFVPFLALRYGVNGAAIGYFIVGCSSIIAIKVVSRWIDINYIDSVFKPLLSALLMGILILVLRNLLPYTLVTFIFLTLTSIIVYLTVSFFILGKAMKDDFRTILKIIKPKI